MNMPGASRGGFFADPGPGSIIQWTKGGEHPAQDALMDYIDTALEGAFDAAAGNFSTPEAYQTFKRRIRQEFIDRMMQIAGGK